LFQPATWKRERGREGEEHKGRRGRGKTSIRETANPSCRAGEKKRRGGERKGKEKAGWRSPAKLGEKKERKKGKKRKIAPTLRATRERDEKGGGTEKKPLPPSQSQVHAGKKKREKNALWRKRKSGRALPFPIGRTRGGKEKRLVME